MILVGLALVAIGVADLCAGGLGGEIASTRRAVAAAVIAVAVASIGLWVTSTADAPAVAALLATALITSFAWSILRLPRFRANRPWLAIIALVAPLSILAATSGSLKAAPSVPAMNWLASLPFPAIVETGMERLCLTVGAAIALMATSNGIVRAVLASAGTLVQSQNRLRGGRLIGAMERLMIFGLALAGEPTAAALIISAKSILRFPEISRTAQRDDDQSRQAETPKGSSPAQPPAVDAVTEYFLLGSLSSWMLALAPIVLLRS